MVVLKLMLKDSLYAVDHVHEFKTIDLLHFSFLMLSTGVGSLLQCLFYGTYLSRTGFELEWKSKCSCSQLNQLSYPHPSQIHHSYYYYSVPWYECSTDSSTCILLVQSLVLVTRYPGWTREYWYLYWYLVSAASRSSPLCIPRYQECIYWVVSDENWQYSYCVGPLGPT